MAAYLLELEHQMAEPRITDKGAFTDVANAPVLTVDAKQVASAEEDSA